MYDKWFFYRDTQRFFDILRPMGEKCLKRILTHLDCTKYNVINLSQLHIQKHVSNKKLHKNYKYYVYRLTQKFFDAFHPTGGKF